MKKIIKKMTPVKIIKVLNNKKSSYTGSITCYLGRYIGSNGKTPSAFISISDCYNTIRLHPEEYTKKGIRQYRKKINKLIKVLIEYDKELEKLLNKKD